MQNLEVTNKKVYELFQNGYHVVRTSQRFWRGLSADLILEQVTFIIQNIANLRLTWVSLKCEFSPISIN